MQCKEAIKRLQVSNSDYLSGEHGIIINGNYRDYRCILKEGHAGPNKTFINEIGEYYLWPNSFEF